MNKFVIDTNVIVAAMRSKRGASFKLISLLGRGYYELYLSVGVMVVDPKAFLEIIGVL